MLSKGYCVSVFLSSKAGWSTGQKRHSEASVVLMSLVEHGFGADAAQRLAHRCFVVLPVHAQPF